jgi:hypothetical protein
VDIELVGATIWPELVPAANKNHYFEMEFIF